MDGWRGVIKVAVYMSGDSTVHNILPSSLFWVMARIEIAHSIPVRGKLET